MLTIPCPFDELDVCASGLVCGSAAVVLLYIVLGVVVPNVTLLVSCVVDFWSPGGDVVKLPACTTASGAFSVVPFAFASVVDCSVGGIGPLKLAVLPSAVLSTDVVVLVLNTSGVEKTTSVVTDEFGKPTLISSTELDVVEFVASGSSVEAAMSVVVESVVLSSNSRNEAAEATESTNARAFVAKKSPSSRLRAVAACGCTTNAASFPSLELGAT